MVGNPQLRDGFRPDRLARLAEMEREHFWFVARRALIEGYLSRYARLRPEEPVLDLGCGTGHMQRRLAGCGLRVVGLDLRPEGLRAPGAALPALERIQARALPLPFSDAAFGAVLLLDVLEHVDDRAVLVDVHRTLRPGGLVFLSVPAFPWLWSHRDAAAGHLRRYRRRGLRELLDGVPLEVLALRYYQCLLFPLAVATRLLGRRRPGLRDLEDRPAAGLNAVLGWINRAEVRLGGMIPWPWGSSLVAVCRKGGA